MGEVQQGPLPAVGPSGDPSAETSGRRMRAVKQRSKPGWRNKLLRAIWSVVWLGLFLPSPRPAHAWRRMLLRLFGARIGKAAMPYPGVRVWAPWNLCMGEGSALADGVECYNVDYISLGRGAIVSQKAFLCSASHDYRDPGFPLVTGPVTVGAFAWVAAEAFVGPGVVIGEGAVVGARAVVMRDVPPWTVVVGNPAVPVGHRPKIK